MIQQKENLKIKTIQIELLEGIPSGFRRAAFTTQLMRVLVVPRDRQELLSSCPEAKFQAVYLIVGETEEGEPQVYIGQTRRMALRIKEHSKGGNGIIGRMFSTLLPKTTVFPQRK